MIHRGQKQVAEEIFAARKRSGSRPEAGEKQDDAEVKDHMLDCTGDMNDADSVQWIFQ